MRRLRCLKIFSRSCWLEANTRSRILPDENEDHEQQQNLQMQEITVIVAHGTCHWEISSTLGLYSSSLSALGAINHCLATNLSLSLCRIPDLPWTVSPEPFQAEVAKTDQEDTGQLFPAPQTLRPCPSIAISEPDGHTNRTEKPTHSISISPLTHGLCVCVSISTAGHICADNQDL